MNQLKETVKWCEEIECCYAKLLVFSVTLRKLECILGFYHFILSTVSYCYRQLAETVR